MRALRLSHSGALRTQWVYMLHIMQIIIIISIIIIIIIREN